MPRPDRPAAASRAPRADQPPGNPGRFDDLANYDRITDSDLSDWAGDWRLVYPLLQDETLDPVISHRAEHEDKTVAEYTDYYQTGYEAEVDRILIEGDRVILFEDGTPLQSRYADDGYEVLTCEAGNRGVQHVFEKSDGGARVPAFVQFGDHAIAPEDTGHLHLFWGNNRVEVLEEVTTGRPTTPLNSASKMWLKK